MITVGCEATTPGWIQTDEKGKLSGYDYDVWQEIGKRIGYEIDYKVMEWDSLWVMLADNRLDSVGEQISYNSEREEKYNLSEPYAYNLYSLLCAKDNEALQSMNDLKSGMTISCETNTSDELIVNAINEHYGDRIEENQSANIEDGGKQFTEEDNTQNQNQNKTEDGLNEDQSSVNTDATEGTEQEV